MILQKISNIRCKIKSQRQKTDFHKYSHCNNKSDNNKYKREYRSTKTLMFSSMNVKSKLVTLANNLAII